MFSPGISSIIECNNYKSIHFKNKNYRSMHNKAPKMMIILQVLKVKYYMVALDNEQKV